MSEGLVALGLLLAIEGALYALFPETMKRVAAAALEMPTDRLRLTGLVATVGGVALVWLVRG